MKSLRLPGEWKIDILENYAYIKGRIGWRGLKASEYTKKGPSLVANKHLNNGKVLWRECDHISKQRYDESPEIQLKKEDIIMSKDGTIGQLAFIDNLPEQATINSTMMLIRSEKEDLLPKYLFYFFQGPFFKRLLRQKVSGGQIPHIFQRDMNKLHIIMPPLKEQEEISKILTILDLVIEKTDMIVQELEHIKQGLVNKYFLKNEKLKFVPLINIFEVKSGSTPSTKNKKYWKDGKVNWLTPADLGQLEGDVYVGESKRKVSDKAVKDANLNIMPANSIVMSTRAPVGYVALLQIESTFNQGCKGLLPRKEEEVNPLFYSYYLSSKRYALENRAGQSTFKELSKTMLEKFNVPQVDIDYQNKVADQIRLVEQKMNLEKDRRDKLKRIKQGLMNDLLTGKKRIKGD
ncbi:MAG: restriction endonuclease subunit S [Candidatus Omnitrophica bacterium]|nr:restriction endonuclease subunit S [Candidatus Omnitrophota bacterium]MDD5488304.1 restriction endonuclease subunit S [Candidatus Omnitrophota bacterium]